MFLLPGHASQATASEALCEVPDRKPKVVHREMPPYPQAALSFCIEGHAAYEITIDADGSVSRALLTDSQPEGVFDQAGEIFQAWRFRPACADGVPVEYTHSIAIDFELEGLVENCPENLSGPVVDMMVALVGNQSAASRQLSDRTRMPVDLPLESDFDEPFASLEIAHRRFINDHLDIERAWRTASWDIIRMSTDADRWQDEQSALEARDALLGLIERRSRIRARWPEALRDLNAELDRIDRHFELDPEARQILIAGREEVTAIRLEEHRLVVAIENALYERYLEHIEWFIDNEQDWAVESAGVVFASSELERAHRERLREIRELETEWFEKYELRDRIANTGF